MKKLFAVLSFAFLFVCTALLLSAKVMDKGKVLLIVRDGEMEEQELMLNNEIGVMTRLLQDAGYKVVVASTTAAPLVAPNRTIKPDIKLAEVKVSDYAGFIVPCLTLDSALPPNLESGIRDAVAKGKPVAGQTGGMIALAKAGVLSRRKIAEIPMPPGEKPVPDDIREAFKDTVRSGIPIVQDGPVITSGVCPMTAKLTGQPDTTTGVTQALIAALNKR